MDRGIKSYNKTELPLKTESQEEKALRENPANRQSEVLTVYKMTIINNMPRKRADNIKSLWETKSEFTKEINEKTRGRWVLSLSFDWGAPIWGLAHDQRKGKKLRGNPTISDRKFLKVAPMAWLGNHQCFYCDTLSGPNR